MQTQILHSMALSTVPPRKIKEALLQTLQDCPECLEKGAKLDNCCNKCRIFNDAIKRYAEANIPVRYWKLSMNNFVGDTILIEKYNEVVSDLKTSYDKGVSFRFGGPHGIGKTMTTTSILKRAVEKNYSALYITLTDIVNCLINAASADRVLARKELLSVDFLCVDEFDLGIQAVN